MRGADLLAGLADPAARHAWQVLGGLDLAGVTADSRRVAPGFLFAALPGARADGADFIAEAVARGAVAVFAPPGTAWPRGRAVAPADRRARRRAAAWPSSPPASPGRSRG